MTSDCFAHLDSTNLGPNDANVKIFHLLNNVNLDINVYTLVIFKYFIHSISKILKSHYELFGLRFYINY